MPEATQTQNGKAFEYACLNAFNLKLNDRQRVYIEESKQLVTAREHYLSITGETRSKLDKASARAAEIIMRLEPQLEYHNGNEPLILSIQTDSRGMQGDVRDVLCLRKQNGWEIGLSCKHNHRAVKHNRLSASIDFGKKWLSLPCSKDYFDAIRPVFGELERIKIESGGKIKWSQIENKAENFYIPALNAFIDELNRLYKAHGDIVPSRLIKYLIGENDFYKVITDDKRRLVRVEAVNISGNLNRPSGAHSSMADVPILALPTKLYHLGLSEGSDNTINLVCDKGWEISMRIHSASTYVEPSLKFDINLISLPSVLYAEAAPYDLNI